MHWYMYGTHGTEQAGSYWCAPLGLRRQAHFESFRGVWAWRAARAPQKKETKPDTLRVSDDVDVDAKKTEATSGVAM
jgi:hypothetical protein